MITIKVLENSFIISHNYHSFIVVRTFKSYSRSNFQVYNTVLLPIITMLFIRFLELIHLRLEVWILWPTSPHFLYPEPQAATLLLSISVSLAFLDSTYK